MGPSLPFFLMMVMWPTTEEDMVRVRVGEGEKGGGWKGGVRVSEVRLWSKECATDTVGSL